MNTACKSLMVAAIATLLAACASTPRTDLAADSRPMPEGQYQVDQRYVESVERASRTAGVRVVWINPPRKADRKD